MNSNYNELLWSMMDLDEEDTPYLPGDHMERAGDYFRDECMAGIQGVKDRLAALAEALVRPDYWEVAEDHVDALWSDFVIVIYSVAARASLARAVIADAEALGFKGAVSA